MRNVALALALVFGTSMIAAPVFAADTPAVAKAKAACAKITDAAKKADCLKKAAMAK